MPVLETFKDLMNEIAYNWNYPINAIIKTEDGCYVVDKLYIQKDVVSYKTNHWYLAPGVYEQFEIFYGLLHPINYHEIREF